MVVFLASMSGVEFCQLTKYGPPGVCMGGGRKGGREGEREGGREGGREGDSTNISSASLKSQK